MTSNDDVTPGPDKDDAVAKAGAAINQMAQGEQLIGLGALIVVLVDLVGDVFLDEYGVSSLLWITAVLALVAVWVRRLRGRDTEVRYEWMLVVLGLVAGIVGLRLLIGGLEDGLFDAGGGTVFFALLTYIGAGLMGFGAYRVAKS